MRKKSSVGNISTHDLSHPPDHNAVSFEWSDRDATELIQLNGHAFRIRRNMWDIFRQIRQKKRSISDPGFFIVALCIDQGSSEEPNAQVQAIAEIYTKASYVYAWLAILADESDSLLELCMPDYFDFLSALIDALQMGQILNSCLPSLDNMDKIAPILALFSRSYWDRLWVIQELVLLKNVFIFCGNCRGSTM